MAQGEAGVQNVLQNHHMAALNVRRKVLLHPDDAGGFGAAAIGGHRHKVNLAINGNGPDHIGKKHHHALQNPHKNGILPMVVCRQLPAQLANASLNLVFG